MPTATKRKLQRLNFPLQREFALEGKARQFDLCEVFDRLNYRYFANNLVGYQIVWMRRRKQKPRVQFVYATICETDKVIKVNPALNQPFVPTWFFDYIIFHEMLHTVVPDEFTPGGRRIVHPPEFYRLEKQFHGYERARQWGEDNLALFLQ